MRFATQFRVTPCLDSTSRVQQKTERPRPLQRANRHFCHDMPDTREIQLAARGVQKKDRSPKTAESRKTHGMDIAGVQCGAASTAQSPAVPHCGHIRTYLFLQDIIRIKLRHALLFPQSARRPGPPERTGPYAREKRRWHAQVQACAGGAHASPAPLRAGVYRPSHPDRVCP